MVCNRLYLYAVMAHLALAIWLHRAYSSVFYSTYILADCCVFHLVLSNWSNLPHNHKFVWFLNRSSLCWFILRMITTRLSRILAFLNKIYLALLIFTLSRGSGFFHSFHGVTFLSYCVSVAVNHFCCSFAAFISKLFRILLWCLISYACYLHDCCLDYVFHITFLWIASWLSL